MTLRAWVGAMFALAAVQAGTGAAAETVSYSGTARLASVKSVLPLASGDAAIIARSTGVAALSTTPPALLTVQCAGLGQSRSETDFTARFYCTFVEDAGNGFDVTGSQDANGGEAELMGGNGRWKDATGSMKFKRQLVEDDLTTVTFELTAERP